jgi:NAD-dependent DNA ligase
MMDNIVGDNHDINGVNLLMSKGFGHKESVNITMQLIDLQRNPLYDTVLFGAIGFDNASTKTFEAILPFFRYFRLNALSEINGSIAKAINRIQGVGPVTAKIIEDEFPIFAGDLEWMYINGNIVEWNPPTGKRVVLSGTRDQELVDFLNTHGFICDPDASLTKSTDLLVIPLEGYTSSKVTKAQSYGIPVVTVNEIMTNYNAYL